MATICTQAIVNVGVCLFLLHTICGNSHGEPAGFFTTRHFKGFGGMPLETFFEENESPKQFLEHFPKFVDLGEFG